MVIHVQYYNNITNMLNEKNIGIHCNIFFKLVVVNKIHNLFDQSHRDHIGKTMMCSILFYINHMNALDKDGHTVG